MRMPKWLEELERYEKYGIPLSPIAGGCGGDEDEPPPPPTRTTAEQALSGSPRLTELDQMLRQYIGKSLGTPPEWGTTGDVYKELLGYTPEQFQFPMEDIQKALGAQQGLQLEQYQKQLRPILANQGQLDSTYYANMLSDYLKGQQAQSYGSTADLLTQQALQNLQLSQWLPQFRAGIAGDLGNLGARKLGLEEQNLMLPLQTYIPGLQRLYGTASGEADKQFQDALTRWQYDTSNFQNQQKQKAGFADSMGTLGGMALGLGLAPFTGGMSIPLMMSLGGAVGGAASPLWGGSGGGIDLGTALALSGQSLGGGSGKFNPQWNTTPKTDYRSFNKQNYLSNFQL